MLLPSLPPVQPHLRAPGKLLHLLFTNKAVQSDKSWHQKNRWHLCSLPFDSGPFRGISEHKLRKMRSQLWLHCCMPALALKSKSQYSQNAFPRGHYVNYSTIANGISRVVVNMQEWPDLVTRWRHERAKCRNQKQVGNTSGPPYPDRAP